MSGKEIKEKVIPILKRHGIVKAALFGSFVRGEETAESDIDLLVEFKERENKTLLDLIGLEQDLSDFLNRKVDVLTYQSLHPRLKTYILNEQEVFYDEGL